MSNVTIKLVGSSFLGNFYFTKEPAKLARELLDAGLYTEECSFPFRLGGVEAAEEAFDLTNNPSRQHERGMYYGRGRSVSVGDIVEVDGVNFLCASFGWEAL